MKFLAAFALTLLSLPVFAQIPPVGAGEAPPTSDRYVCLNPNGGGGSIVSVTLEKIWMVETASDTQGLMFPITNIQRGVDAHQFTFDLDLMGQATEGSISGDHGADPITFTLNPKGGTDGYTLPCTYEP